MRNTIIVAGIFCVLGLACRPVLPPVDSRLLDPNGAFTLYVSNQSFAITPVDITVAIDGEVVVREYFEVGNQHSWKKFTLTIPNGRHTVNVASRKGGATLTKEIEVTGRHWAVTDFWYYPNEQGGAGPTPRSFSFTIQDTPILFQ